jgi:hypothetical protein
MYELKTAQESRWTHTHILLSQIRDTSNLEGHVPVFIAPRNRMAQLYPQALGFFCVASYTSQDHGGGIPALTHLCRLSDIASERIHRKHRFQQYFHCCPRAAA